MIKPRRLILIGMLVLLTFLNAFMSFSSFAVEKVSILSLKQAQDEAIKNSVVLKEHLRNIDSLSDEYEQAYDGERSVKKNKDGKYDDLDTSERIKYESGYKTKEVDIKTNNTKLKSKKDEENIKLNVLLTYQDILLKQKEIEVATQNLDVEKKNLDSSKIKYNLGKISSYENEKAKKNYESIVLDISTKKNDLENYYKKLNILRGSAIEERPILSMASISSIESKPISSKDALEIALKNRYDVISSANESTLAELDLKNISTVYPDNTYKYKEKERAFKNSKEKYEDSKNNIKEEVENAYSAILTCKLQGEDIQLSIDKLKKDIDQKNNLFKHGRISEMELKNAKKDLSLKELDYMKNTFEYQKLLESYIVVYTYGK